MREHAWSMDEDGNGDLYTYCAHDGCNVSFPSDEPNSLLASVTPCRVACDCPRFPWEPGLRHPEITLVPTA